MCTLVTTTTKQNKYLVILSLINAPDQLMHVPDDVRLQELKARSEQNPRYKGLVVFAKAD